MLRKFLLGAGVIFAFTALAAAAPVFTPAQLRPQPVRYVMQRPYVRPFVRPFVARPFVRPFAARPRPFVRPYVQPRPYYVQPRVLPRPYYVQPQPYVQPQYAQPQPQPYTQPQPPATQNVSQHIYTQPRATGGTYIFIKGQIVPGDEQEFASLQPPEPVYVRPSGPGGNAATGLAIADIIWQRGYNTLLQNFDGECASACTWIWLSGHHAIVQNSAILLFHSCYDTVTNQDSMECDADVAAHLIKYGYTQSQSLFLADPSTHTKLTLGTKELAAILGFTWQTIPSLSPGWGDNCTMRFCIGFP